jgi:hypothetical protein
MSIGGTSAHRRHPHPEVAHHHLEEEVSPKATKESVWHEQVRSQAPLDWSFHLNLPFCATFYYNTVQKA